LKTLTDAIR